MKGRLGLVCMLALGGVSLACDDGSVRVAVRDVAPRKVSRNLLLITVDTLRADHLGCYGSVLDLSPQIDALAAESTRFLRAYSPAPFTLPAVGALMTGRYPETIGLRHNLSRVPKGTSTLAAELQGHGFETGAVVSNPVLAARSHLDRGFAHYDAEFPETEANREASERGATATTDAALEMLGRLGGEPAPAPFFLWVHYQDPHGPYTPPEKLRDRYLEDARRAPDGRRSLPALEGWRGPGGIPAYQFIAPHQEAAWYRAGYAGEVRHVDDEVGRLLGAVSAAGLYDDTVVVFTADHGEALGERDYWFAHGEHLDDAAVRVPLIVRIPGAPAAQREDAVSLVDVVPTVAALLGLSFAEPLAGVNLFAAEARDAGRAVYTSTNESASSRVRRAIVADGFKLVREFSKEGQREQLFRLPNERADLASEHAERRIELARRLDASGPRPLHAAKSAPAASREEIERLRALGYVFEEPAAPMEQTVQVQQTEQLEQPE